MNRGFTEFAIPERELAKLADGYEEVKLDEGGREQPMAQTALESRPLIPNEGVRMPSEKTKVGKPFQMAQTVIASCSSLHPIGS